MHPLTPSDCDLQDFPFMPLHVARLRDSDLAAEGHPEGCWYAVLLWSASWHQLPAGSLPDNDAVLARLCGLGRDVKTFKRRREDALRGWLLADDGRLYHPVVAEQVIAAWESKRRQRHRTLCAAIRQHNSRKPEDQHDSPTFEAWMLLECPTNIADLVTALSRVTGAVPERDNVSKRQGQGEGQGDSISDASASAAEAAPAPPLDPAKVMFDAGLRILTAAGSAPAKARTLIGKWKRDYGAEAVIIALGAAEREGASEPVSFITAALETRNGNRPRQHQPGATDPLLAACLVRLAAGDPHDAGLLER